MHVHFEDFGDVFAFEANLQRFAIEAMTVADGAGDPNVGEKIHFEAVGAVAFAGFAAAPFDVETEAAGFVAASFGFGKFGEQIADVVGELDVRGRIGSWRAADGGLIDGDQFVEMLEALDAVVGAGITVT